MKPLLIALLLPFTTLAQPTAKDVLREVTLAGLAFTSGYAYGTAESVTWHYPAWQARHPKADPLYWNPNISWRNKYAGGDPLNGPRFRGSTTALVWTTDGYHLMRAIDRAGWVGSIALTVTIGERKPWQYYVWAVARSYVGYMAGFHLGYVR